MPSSARFPLRRADTAPPHCRCNFELAVPLGQQPGYDVQAGDAQRSFRSLLTGSTPENSAEATRSAFRGSCKEPFGAIARSKAKTSATAIGLMMPGVAKTQPAAFTGFATASR